MGLVVAVTTVWARERQAGQRLPASRERAARPEPGLCARLAEVIEALRVRDRDIPAANALRDLAEAAESAPRAFKTPCAATLLTHWIRLDLDPRPPALAWSWTTPWPSPPSSRNSGGSYPSASSSSGAAFSTSCSSAS